MQAKPYLFTQRSSIAFFFRGRFATFYLPNAAVFADRGSARLIRLATLVLTLQFLAACAVAPGTQLYSMRNQSAVKLPVRQGDEVIPANVVVRPITAKLIIELEQLRKPVDTTHLADLPHADYKLGPGDIINVIVYEHPELTSPAGTYITPVSAGTLVDERGEIYYPYVGILKVQGMTVPELRALLSQRLSKFIANIQLDIRVAAFRNKRVYVVGEVANPGLQEITDIPLTILDAIAAAGGFTQQADHSQVVLTRKGVTYRVDLQALFEQGAITQNPALEPGDIVNVPDNSFNKVFVLGEVLKPGPYSMNKKRITLAEALSEAGYIDQLTSNPHWIFVMRGRSDSPELFHLDSKSPDALILADRFPLEAHDIVYVDAADVARFNRVISNLSPIFGFFGQSPVANRLPIFGGNR